MKRQSNKDLMRGGPLDNHSRLYFILGNPGSINNLKLDTSRAQKVKRAAIRVRVVFAGLAKMWFTGGDPPTPPVPLGERTYL